MGASGSQELAILITIEAINKAQAGLADVQKELDDLGTSADAMGASAGGAKGDLEDLGAASGQAFGDTSTAAEDATAHVDEFGNAVVGASAVAQTELANTAIAAENLSGTTQDLGTTADTTGGQVSGMANDVTDAADAAVVADTQHAELADTTTTLGEATDATAASTGELTGELTGAADAAAVTTASHQSLTAAVEDTSNATEDLAVNSTIMGKTGAAGANEMGKSLGKMGKWAVVGGAAIGLLAVHMAGDFDMAGNRLVTSAGQTRAGLAGVQKGILTLSEHVGQSATGLESAMYLVESASFHGSKGLTVLKAAAEGATEEQATLQTVATAVTSVLKAYSLSATKATAVTTEMLTATSHGKMTFQTLASSLNTVLPLANALGVTLAQVTGAIATMTAQGKSAQTAAQDVKALMNAFTKPNATQVNMLQQIGLTPVKMQQELKSSGITGITKTLQTAVVAHMQKSGTAAGMVVVTAFKKSNLAVQDSHEMLSKMPPALHRIALAYSENKITASEWGQQIGYMAQKTQQMASQFATTLQNTQAFNTLLTTGSAGVQTYVQVMEELTGTTTAATAALQLSGKHAGTFTSNVKSISDASKHAGKNIKTWGATTKQFNVELKNLEGKLEAFAITLGNKITPLLPKVEAGFEKFFGELKKSGALADMEHGLEDLKGPLEDVGRAVDFVTQHLVKSKGAMEVFGIFMGTVAIAGVAMYINKLTHLSKILGGVYKAGKLALKGIEWAGGKLLSTGKGAGAGTETTGTADTQDAATAFQEKVGEAGQTFQEQVDAAGETLASRLEAAGTSTSTEMEAGATTASADLEAGATTASADLETGATTASADMEAGGTAVSTDLDTAGAAFSADADTAGTAVSADMDTAGAAFAADTDTAGTAFSADVDSAGATFTAEAAGGGAAGGAEEAAGGAAAGGLTAGSAVLGGAGALFAGYQLGSVFAKSSMGKSVVGGATSGISDVLGMLGMKTTHGQFNISGKNPTAVKNITVGKDQGENLAKLEAQITNATKSSKTGFRQHLTGISAALKAELPKAFLGALTALPKAAAGGVVSKPTLLIAGEAGEEYIIPKSMMGGANPGSGKVGALTPKMASSMSGSNTTIYQIETLVVTAQNPAQLEQQLSQKSRVSALSSKPSGGSNLAVAT